MEEKIECLVRLKDYEKEFYNYLIFLVATCDNDQLNKYLDKYNVNFSEIKFKMYMLSNMQHLYFDIVNQKDFPIEFNYYNILKSYSDIAKNLNINTPLEQCIFFDEIFTKGYLAIYKNIIYKEEAYDDYYGPYLAITGKGVCRNFCQLLKDYLTVNNIKSDYFINKLVAYDNTLIESIVGNHVALIIHDETCDFIYDPTNNSLIIKKYGNRYKALETNDTYINKTSNIKDFNIVNNKSDFIENYYDTKEKIQNIVKQNENILWENHRNLRNDFLEIKDYIDQNNSLSRKMKRYI